MRQNRTKRRNASHPVTAYGVVRGYDRRGRMWQQEHYESKSGDARVRAAQLRKLGFKVSVSSLGPQVTPVGTVRMTMLTIPDMDPEQLIPAPDQVKRLNSTTPRRGAPGGGPKRTKKNAPTRLSVPERHQLKIARDTLRMPDAMVGVMGGMTKQQAREIFRRLMAKARGAKNPRGRRPKKNAPRRRMMNYGEGNLFNFHGAFTEKAAAVAKEQSIPGAFIRTVWFKGGPRYGVLTPRKNPAQRRKKNQFARSHAVAQKRVAIKRKLRALGYKFAPDISYADLAKLVMQAKKKNSGIVNSIRPGDRVTIVNRFGQQSTGRAVMRSSSGGWVLNMGGPHGTPGIASAENIVKVSKRKNSVAWGKPDEQFVHQALAQLFPGKPPEQLTMAQLSKVMQLAQALKAKAASRKNSSRRHNAEWGTYEKGVFHPWPRRPKTRKKKAVRRRNYENATELYEKFHGKKAGRVSHTNLPTAEYGNHPELGQLGKMVSLTIGDEEAEKPWKKKIEWGSSEAPDLAAEPGGRQLYLIGGSQNLNGALEHLPLDTDKDLLDLGFAYRLEYFTQKKFDNFQPVTYYHDLGEETGDRPRVVYDRVKKRIHLVGGAYEVKPEGIVN